MDKAHTLKLNKEFRRLYYRGRCQASHLLVMYAGKNHLKTVRLGITAGKKVGGAVERNRAKRVLRAAFAAVEDRIQPGFDLVLVARTATPGAKSQEVQRDLEKALGKLGLLRQ